MTKAFLNFIAAAFFAAAPAHAESISNLVIEKVSESYEYQLPDSSTFDIRSGSSVEADALQISDFWFDKPTSQFIANVSMADGTIQRVAGLAIVMLSVPVPTRRLMPGEIIKKDDIVTASLPQGRVSSFAVVDPCDLIGMEVKRMLAQGRAVAHQSVTAPIVINRGDKVEIQFSNNLMSLTAPGRATSDAALGEQIKVINLVSNSTVIAFAKSDRIVEVSP